MQTNRIKNYNHQVPYIFKEKLRINKKIKKLDKIYSLKKKKKKKKKLGYVRV